MWENIIVCGGSSMFPGFLERLKKEVEMMSPDNASPVVRDQDRFINTFLGACNLAYYNEFYDWSITCDEFVVEGEEIFEIKCIN